MMHGRRRRLALFGVAIMAVAVAGATAWADDMAVAVANAGMEEEAGGKPTHWQLWTTSAADASFIVDHEVWRGGQGAVRRVRLGSLHQRRR